MTGGDVKSGISGMAEAAFPLEAVGVLVAPGSAGAWFFFAGRGFGRGRCAGAGASVRAGNASVFTAAAASASAFARTFSASLYPSGAAGALSTSESVAGGGQFSAM